MRTAFVRTLTELAAKDPRINLITGDLGFGVLENYARCFPKQYLNAGVAEQNMVGLATGMALCGKTVFTYSIGNFPTLRCLEQIRNDICYHNANVKIVCIGGGFAYGSLGISHHATEERMALLVGRVVDEAHHSGADQGIALQFPKQRLARVASPHDHHRLGGPLRRQAPCLP